MATTDYRPRLSVEVTEEQKEKLTKYLGGVYGLQKTVFGVIIDDLIRVMETPKGEVFIAALVRRHLKMTDFVKVEEPTEAQERV